MTAPSATPAPVGVGSPSVRRSDLGSRLGGLAMLAGVLVLALWVPFNVSLGALTDLVGLFVLVILGTTWNLMAGYGGMVSIGQQAFVGAGGYAAVYVGNQAGLPAVVLLLVAAGVGALLAVPTSFLMFRLVGGYFAIGTWVVAEVFKLLTTQVDALGGGSGMSLMVFRGVDRVDRIALVYWSGLAAAVIVVVLTYVVMRSPMGLGLTSVRDDAVAASSLGVDVQRIKRIVYVTASGGAGVAGALIALNALRVTPASVYSVNYTAFMIFVVVIGGLGTIEGPVLGAVVFWVLQQQLASYGTWYLVVLGGVAVLAVLALPRGLWGLVSRGGRVQLFPVGYRLGSAERSPE
jgi:branched-chain amino acid transport system permease protein